MKRYGMLAVVILAGLAVAWPLFAQEAEEGPRAGGRERRGRGRRMSSEEQQKAFAAIEEQLGKMKAGMEGMPRDREGWRDLSDEERDKLRENFRKMRDQRRQSLAVITEQIDKLKGPRQLRQEYEEAIGKLDAILKSAQKENAKETAAGIEKLIDEKKKQLEEKFKALGFDPDAGRDRRPR
jgi:hypothetical protein